MGRAPRVELPGAIYHVTQRGNNQETIFCHDVDRKYFIKLLVRNKPVQGFELYGFVLMGNHYHLLLKTRQEPLSTVMHRINNSYSKYFNSRYDRRGHVFQGRYKSRMVTDEQYLLTVLRYIHQNPVKAGLCRRVSDYKWSSDVWYRRGHSGLVDTGFVLRLLDHDLERAREAYARIMSQSLDYEVSCLVEASPEELWQQYRKADLENLLHSIVASDRDLSLIKQGARLRRLKPLKIAYAQEALKQGFSLSEIGATISLSRSGVTRLLKKKRE